MLGEPRGQEWIDHYEPQQWVAVYELPWSSQEDREAYLRLCATLEASPLFVCGAESDAAKEYWKQNKTTRGVFFYDFEQMAIECAGFNINLSDIKGCWGPDEIGILREEWRGHPPGSLVYSFYRGVSHEPPFITVAVAKPRW